MTALLRPLSVGEILDGGFGLYRRNFPLLFGISLVYAVILTVLLTASPNLGVVFSLLIAVPMQSMLISAGSIAIHGEVPTFANVSRVAVPRLLPVLGAYLLFCLAFAGTLILLVIPGIWFALNAIFVLQVAVLEPGAKPIRRSFALAKGELGKVFAISIVIGLVMLIPATALRLGTHTDALAAGDWKQLLAPDTGIQLALSQLITAVIAPFSALTTTLLYFDQRVRKEGYDVHRATEAALARG